MRPDHLDALHSATPDGGGIALRTFLGVLGLAVGAVVGFIVALFAGLIPFNC